MILNKKMYNISAKSCNPHTTTLKYKNLKYITVSNNTKILKLLKLSGPKYATVVCNSICMLFYFCMR